MRAWAPVAYYLAGCEYKIVQILKMFFLSLKITTQNRHVTPRLILSKGLKTETQFCMPVSFVALVTISNIWKQLVCPLM